MEDYFFVSEKHYVISYDSESGFYYLMCRYYDPVTHRFINTDVYFQSGGGILDANMHAYCGNNPIIRADPNGEFWFAMIAVVVITSTIVLSGCTNKTDNSNSSTPSDYRNVSTSDHNCYSYAFDLPYSANPGDFSATSYNYSDRMYSDKSVYSTTEISNFVMRDMKALNKRVRIIDYPSEICCRNENINKNHFRTWNS